MRILVQFLDGASKIMTVRPLLDDQGRAYYVTRFVTPHPQTNERVWVKELTWNQQRATPVYREEEP